MQSWDFRRLQSAGAGGCLGVRGIARERAAGVTPSAAQIDLAAPHQRMSRRHLSISAHPWLKTLMSNAKCNATRSAAQSHCWIKVE